MDDNQVMVNRVSWPDLCPALLIFRALPTALSLTVLVLALLGAVVTPVGWIVMESVLVTDNMRAEDPGLARAAEVNGSPYMAVFPEGWNDRSVVTVLGQQLRGVELFFWFVVNSVAGLFSVQPGLLRFIYFLGGALWTVAVWSFFGCAICRAALMRYTRDDPIGVDDAFKFAIGKFLSCFAGITIPLLAVVGLTLPLAVIGLLMTTNLGAMIGGFLWFFVLILSLMIATILLGLCFAWPLVITAVSCEGQDSFDGMSRAFAYVFQRPLHYFAYALVAVVFSGICWLVMSMVIEGTIHTAWWATSWGSNIVTDRTGELSGESDLSASTVGDVATRQLAVPGQPGGIATGGLPSAEQNGTSTSTSLRIARGMIGFWNGVARTLGAAFLYGLFWSIASAVYLLLRKDLDNTEMDEIYQVDQRRTYELPPLRDTESGIPAVDRPAPMTDPAEPPTDDEPDAP